MKSIFDRGQSRIVFFLLLAGIFTMLGAAWSMWTAIK